MLSALGIDGALTGQVPKTSPPTRITFPMIESDEATLQARAHDGEMK